MEIDYFLIVRRMTQLNLLHRIHIHRAAAKNDSYFGQLPILEYIIHHDRCTQRELAETLQVSAPSIATSVKRMQKTGLLKKQGDENDLRCTRISITEKGREQAEKCRSAFNAVDGNMFKGFNEKECEQFYEYLNRLIANMTTDELKDKTIKKDDLRRSLAMVLQDTHLFTGTVRDNIRYGKLDATDEEVVAAAKLANADYFIRHLPQGYDTMLISDGANLSQGQCQLLAIARAAVADPPALILDEATSSIDTRTEALIEKGMDKLMNGRTVFVIAHRLSTVRNSNAIMVLENGEIIERGSHNDLIEAKGKYYQLYTGQFELS